MTPFARWGLVDPRALTDRVNGTWAAERDGRPVIVKFFTEQDWRYPLRVAAALRALGWPTPEPIEAPLVVPEGAWVMFERLPGVPRDRGPDEQRARGRLLAELHAAAAETGITDQRGGFATPAEVVADPELEHWLRTYEAARPEEGGILRRCRDAAVSWFDAHPAPDAPRGVIHGDFAPWNLLYDDGRLTGLIDFEASHHTFQVADFVLSWRGYQDEVLRGYQEVRPLSELEREMIRPVYRAWMFLGLKKRPATGRPPDLTWQLTHIGRL
ncbi:phosphotransferase [Actinoplanes sichuanensis]|uniref:Phosphotransferase enzyme family protein n=1 Tax=Actinoplanes sichuanensis TaxID=512349 RepID=A0ABW4AT34_9ACTN|nr:phosphotransferase [Actinoplanes sichuanensis]BEL04660.1 phosphotransferase [Actinoplanes sichuanensis]